MGTLVLVFVFRLPPGSPPVDAFFIIIAVITASAAMQAAFGVDPDVDATPLVSQ